MMIVILFIIGLVFLVVGAESLVRGASKLAIAFGISPLVVGLTVVAYGTSAPELAVSVQSGAMGQADIALGNVIGSNISNVLLILGLSALLAPLIVARQLVRFDVPLMIGASVLVLLLGLDGSLGRLDGAILFVGALSYTAWLIYESRRKSHQSKTVQATTVTDGDTGSYGGWAKQIGQIVLGLALLVIGSRWLVDGAVTFARSFGVSELIIGLTIVAVGTSLPEAATSVIASLRGERDIAVGNVVGSSIFNILAVLGLSCLVAPEGMRISSSALSFDIPVMITVAVACLPIFFTGYLIARWEGGLFLAYYAAYTAYLVLRETRSTALPLLSHAMLYFVLPLTFVTLVVLSIQSLRSRQSLLAESEK